MSQSQKVCADCQHLRINPQSSRHGPVCGSDAFVSDPVTGNPVQNCDLQRIRPNGKCGVDGKLFEPRDAATYVIWVSRPGPLLDLGYTA